MAVPKGRQFNTGRTHFKKGYIPWNKGLKMSDSTKAKIMASKKKNPTRYWLGKKRSLETIGKIRKANLGKEPWNKGKKQWQTTGEKNPNWKGGTCGTGRHRLMGQVDYKLWRESVFKRDNYTCQLCGQRGVYLQADHIKSWADYSALRFDINNGRTLCMDCHYFITFGKEMPSGMRWGKFI